MELRPMINRTAKLKVTNGGNKTIKALRSASPRKTKAMMNKSNKNFMKKLPTLAI